MSEIETGAQACEEMEGAEALKRERAEVWRLIGVVDAERDRVGLWARATHDALDMVSALRVEVLTAHDAARQSERVIHELEAQLSQLKHGGGLVAAVKANEAVALADRARLAETYGQEVHRRLDVEAWVGGVLSFNPLRTTAPVHLFDKVIPAGSRATAEKPVDLTPEGVVCFVGDECDRVRVPLASLEVVPGDMLASAVVDLRTTCDERAARIEQLSEALHLASERVAQLTDEVERARFGERAAGEVRITHTPTVTVATTADASEVVARLSKMHTAPPNTPHRAPDPLNLRREEVEQVARLLALTDRQVEAVRNAWRFGLTTDELALGDTPFLLVSSVAELLLDLLRTCARDPSATASAIYDAMMQLDQAHAGRGGDGTRAMLRHHMSDATALRDEACEACARLAPEQPAWVRDALAAHSLNLAKYSQAHDRTHRLGAWIEFILEQAARTHDASNARTHLARIAGVVLSALRATYDAEAAINYPLDADEREQVSHRVWKKCVTLASELRPVSSPRPVLTAEEARIARGEQAALLDQWRAVRDKIDAGAVVPAAPSLDDAPATPNP